MNKNYMPVTLYHYVYPFSNNREHNENNFFIYETKACYPAISEKKLQKMIKEAKEIYGEGCCIQGVPYEKYVRKHHTYFTYDEDCNDYWYLCDEDLIDNGIEETNWSFDFFSCKELSKEQIMEKFQAYSDAKILQTQQKYQHFLTEIDKATLIKE